MRRIAKTFFLVLPWSILLVMAGYFVLAEGWKDLTQGRLHRKANSFFQDTGITEVRIYRLHGTSEQITSDAFLIKNYREDGLVYGSITLTGDDAGDFMKLWERQLPVYWKQALCHDPPYGFRLYRGGQMIKETTLCWHCKMIKETTLCWHCNNFSIDVWPFGSAWYGFESESSPGQDLLAFCDKRLPYARENEQPKETKPEK